MTVDTESLIGQRQDWNPNSFDHQPGTLATRPWCTKQMSMTKPLIK